MANFSAIVLAAGDSKRMGRPKALLEWRGKFFVEHLCENLRLAGVEDRIVVIGKDSKTILSAWKPKGEKTAVNPRPDMGQISSFRTGVEAAGDFAEGYMVCLVDQPMIKPETYKQIINLWTANKDCIVIPKYLKQVTSHKSQVTSLKSQTQFKRGHPIIIPAVYRSLCFEGPLEKGLHWVTHHQSARIAEAEVEDKNILKDFDLPEDYEQLSSKT
ncbi:MAG: nucleotidyltransferase family protein [Elusimicrobia bacterium]|nr:nucleotidyltransferase family protein [Elusimicrobiota bacterium]